MSNAAESSRPRFSDVHLLRTGQSGHLFLVDGSQLFDLDANTFASFVSASSDGEVSELLTKLGLTRQRPHIGDEVPGDIPLRAISLAIAQKCNLGCTYCYAREGEFGSSPKNMPLETALASIDLLISETRPDERINLAFLGGEPLINRAVLRQATAYASERAHARGQKIGFSITTNGTLINGDDADFFESHGFAVTVSLDGPATVHDRLRPFKSGRGSYDRIIERVRPLLRRTGRLQTTARVTVTPTNLGLKQTLDELLGIGFHSVGFSPMLASPTGRGELDEADLQNMLAAMIECGEEFERRVMAGERYAFSNITTALHEIHKGTHRPYPCGAGGAYLGVSADGELAACHRFVGDEAGAMGSIEGGIDHDRKTAWLEDRHVHRQQPCRTCWARYLCGGGCHHEVIARGRPACDFIRGWLLYALQTYLRLGSEGLGRAFGAGSGPAA
ncbi:radical SAM protein [Bradyrhizobium lupini]|uniref:radical SAM protein n=1 Tax=Rhizobium lupini TaxID=136996 RepID=UPI00366E02C4